MMSWIRGQDERGLDIWSRVLPGRQAIGGEDGWLGRLVRGSVLLGGVLTRGEWATLVAGVVVGLEIGLHAAGRAAAGL